MATVARRALEQALSRPEAALFVMEEKIDGAEAGSWGVTPLLALMDLLEKPPRETHRKRAMALLDPEGGVARFLSHALLTPENKEALVARLQTWQGSDRHRFPLLDFLRHVMLEEIAEAVEGHRARAAARVSNRMNQTTEDPYAGVLVLTRATWTRLQQERTRVGMELKTAIPQAIQKARELGDLRENAEYEAAKAKQAAYAKRFEELEAMLSKTQLIEDMEREAGVALPGTEIDLEPVEAGAEGLTLWLLGEGDQDLGRDVVSYKAPVGRAVLGKREGDEVTLARGAAVAAYRVRSIRERLP
jgi:transcription elongation factor GreA